MILKRTILLFGFFYFFIALIGPLMGWAIFFEGSDYEKLQHMPFVCALSSGFILSLISINELEVRGIVVRNRRQLLAMSILGIFTAATVAYYGLIGNSAILLSLTAFTFNAVIPSKS